MRKKIFEDDRVFFSKSASGARTSTLGDATLGQLPQPKPEPKPEPSRAADGAPEPKPEPSRADAPKPSTLLHRAAGDGAPIKDKEGLDEAYMQGDAAVRGDTMYVAGSHYAIDWADDFTRVPFWGDVRKSYRYKQVDKVLDANPQVHTIVAHSLGGAVAHELQRNRPGLRTVTYGSPSVSWRDRGGERYRNGYDPVSILDRGAVQLVHPNPGDYKAFTHDYHNNENVSAKDSSYGKENPDGTVSITE
jgi:hypothetical protein